MDSKEKAQKGLALLKEAIVECLEAHPDGLRNVDIADKLDIHSDYLGKNYDYLPWSVLGLLLNEEKVQRRGQRYFAADDSSKS
jgi:hypothetical protein